MKIDPNKCIGCQMCKTNCPMDAITVNAMGKCEIDTTKCVNCCTCLTWCPADAISQDQLKTKVAFSYATFYKFYTI